MNIRFSFALVATFLVFCNTNVYQVYGVKMPNGVVYGFAGGSGTGHFVNHLMMDQQHPGSGNFLYSSPYQQEYQKMVLEHLGGNNLMHGYQHGMGQEHMDFGSENSDFGNNFGSDDQDPGKHYYHHHHNYPIPLAVNSHERKLQTIPTQSHHGAPKPTILDIPLAASPIVMRFKTRSSPIIFHNDYASGKAHTEHSQSVEQPHRMVHEVIKPVWHEILEQIKPKRKIVQMIYPVEEEVKTVVHKDEHAQEHHGHDSDHGSQNQGQNHGQNHGQIHGQNHGHDHDLHGMKKY